MGKDRLTHYLFRYPAKFHPPIVDALIKKFSRRGDLILDPFVGSGTTLVEALIAGRSSVGVDVDPIAISVAKAKLVRLNPKELASATARLCSRIKKYERSPSEYRRRMHVDLSPRNFSAQSSALKRYIPKIPDIEHWFRRYVIVDLAHILRAIDRCSFSPKHRKFFEVVFASIIRNSSNADPIPVSGLEVTAHMLRRDEDGREVNPFALFRQALRKGVEAAGQLHAIAPTKVHARAVEGSATRIHRAVKRDVDAVITSPPYQGAVDYYRRHKLEMYWLSLTKSEKERLKLLDRYIGRVTVPSRLVRGAERVQLGALASTWERRMLRFSRSRAAGFRHYIESMTEMFCGLARLMRANRPAVFVVGNSRWNGFEVPTAALLQEAASKYFKTQEILTYPIKNRYMSYTRHNGANIRKEFVLVMRRNRARCPKDARN